MLLCKSALINHSLGVSEPVSHRPLDDDCRLLLIDLLGMMGGLVLAVHTYSPPAVHPIESLLLSFRAVRRLLVGLLSLPSQPSGIVLSDQLRVKDLSSFLDVVVLPPQDPFPHILLYLLDLR